MARLTMVEALNAALAEEMASGSCEVVLGEDIRFDGGLFGVTGGLLEAYGEDRVIDMPISEAGFTGFGIGCAVAGAPAVVEIQIFDFVMLALDQICNRAAKLRYMTGGQVSVPLVVRGPTASRIGLAAQHSQSLEGWFLHAPGLKVVTPSNPHDAKGLLKTAIRDPDPVVFIEHRSLYGQRGEVPDEEYVVPFGEARIVRAGDDVTVIANSIGVRVAEEAARELEGAGISAEVIDLRTIKPLDMATLETSIAKTGHAVVVNEGNQRGGVGSEVMASIAGGAAFWHLDAPLARVGVPDVPVPYAKELETEVLPQPGHVVEAVRGMLAS